MLAADSVYKTELFLTRTTSRHGTTLAYYNDLLALLCYTKQKVSERKSDFVLRRRRRSLRKMLVGLLGTYT